jgi:4-hydroxy-tetrahydrodipicolinate synthase
MDTDMAEWGRALRRHGPADPIGHVSSDEVRALQRQRRAAAKRARERDFHALHGRADGADMLHDTVLRLAQIDSIFGIKEATGNIERAQWLIRDVPQGFGVYSGDDPTAVALMLCGGHGNVSVTANVAPRLMSALCAAALAGNIQRAMEIQFQLMPLHKHLFVEANPIPVKWAVARMGHCGGTLRLPMTELSAANQPVVETALRNAGLI